VENGGGVTRELLALPPGGDWRVRVSVADVASDGDFSTFAGVERWFAVVEGAGVVLTVDGREHRCTRDDGEALSFAGQAKTSCRLIDRATRDLNLMLRGGRGALARVVAGRAWQPRERACGLYATAAGTVRVADEGTSGDARASAALVGHRAGDDRVRRHGLVARRRRGSDAVTTTLCRGARLATFADPRGWGLVERGALLVEDDTIAWVGADDDLPADTRVDDEIDLKGALVTPGLVDCHTHLVYAGQRAGEFERRLEGASYEEIARAGGGIRSTVAATRAASDDALYAAARARALALMSEGVTTVEIKSGYGLSAEHEARCLRVARKLGRTLPLAVRTTCLSAHALPPEYDGRADDYIDAVCAWLPALQREGLVDAVDAFCERIAFTPAQTRRVFEAARALGLPVKLHAEQLSDSGGAALAAEFGALSCEHLEHLSETGVRAMANAGSVAVLLPGAYYFCARRRRRRSRSCAPRAFRSRSRPTTTRARRRRSRRC
jgi:imidazolonepropionase